jgi:hypothetical protein
MMNGHQSKAEREEAVALELLQEAYVDDVLQRSVTSQ